TRAAAGAARQFQHQPVTLRNPLQSLGLEFSARGQTDRALGPVAPAVAAAGGPFDPLKHGQHLEAGVVAGAHLDHLAEAAASLANAAAVGAELLAPDDD